MPPFTILLIDDHAMFRAGLRVLLEGRLPGVRMLEAASIDDAERLPIAAPDLLLLDIQLQEGSGLDGISAFRQRWPGIVVAVLSAWHTPRNISQALAQGVRAFIPKTAPADAVIELVEQLYQTATGSKTSARENSQQPHLQRLDLTPRQCDVLDLLCRGLSNKGIGRRLGLSENTIRWHVQNLLKLLRVSSRSEAVFVARSLGLTD